ncbi:MAG: hypothetical protein WDN46_23085 [Methylocella sp.]
MSDGLSDLPYGYAIRQAAPEIPDGWEAAPLPTQAEFIDQHSMSGTGTNTVAWVMLSIVAIIIVSKLKHDGGPIPGVIVRALHDLATGVFNLVTGTFRLALKTVYYLFIALISVCAAVVCLVILYVIFLMFYYVFSYTGPVVFMLGVISLLLFLILVRISPPSIGK